MGSETTEIISSSLLPEESGSEGQVKNRRLAKKTKQLVLQGKGTKSDYFDIYGVEAKAEAILQPPAPNSRLNFQDFQNLVRWILADGSSPKWVFIKNKPLVTKLTMLHLPGLDAALYMAHPNLFKNLTQCCGIPRAAVAVSPLATPAQTLEAIFSCPKIRQKKDENHEKRDQVLNGLDVGEKFLSIEGSDSEEEERPKRQKVGDGGSVLEVKSITERKPSFPASYYTLTLRQMHENGYPKAEVDGSVINFSGFVKTRPAAPNVIPLEMVAVDCEMCYTREGLELTRVSLVDCQGRVILDKLVKPENPITDYNTQYSGITAAMMADVTTTLADIQELFLKLVAVETIIVGHSVENDLHALKILHPLVIDTALLYHHPSRGPPCKPALRMLTARFLQRKIQGDSKVGHDSVEDARATMDLALLKIGKGPAFGRRTKPHFENLVEVLSRHNRRSTLIDRRPMLHHYAVGSCNAIVATTDEDVLAKAVKEVKKKTVDFVWAQLTDLNTYYEDQARSSEDMAMRMAEMAALATCSKGSKSVNFFPTGSMKQDSESTALPLLPRSLETILAQMDNHVKKIHDALPPNSLLIVVTGHGDTASVRRVQELKWKSLQNKQAGSDRWSENKEAVLEEFGACAETTLAFTCIK